MNNDIQYHLDAIKALRASKHATPLSTSPHEGFAMWLAQSEPQYATVRDAHAEFLYVAVDVMKYEPLNYRAFAAKFKTAYKYTSKRDGQAVTKVYIRNT